MEKRPIFPMTQLDTLVTTQELQLMKLMLPYIPANMRGILAVYIKFTEFINTIHLFHSTGNGSPDGPIHSKSIHSPEDILQDLSSFMDPAEADNISMIFQYDEYHETNGPIQLRLSGKQQRDVSDDRSVR